MKEVDTKNKGLVKKTLLFSLVLMATLAVSAPAFADCDGKPEQYRRVNVTYYEEQPKLYNPNATTDSRCTILPGPGPVFCRVRLRGVIYLPPTALTTSTFPAIIVNHGSGANFEANKKYCEIANYFVPKGYIVFVPFRRGYGDGDAPYPNDLTQISDKSTGIYMEDFIADFVSAHPKYHHSTSCTDADARCYRAELFEQEAKQEVADYAINYLKSRHDIKTEGPGNYDIAIMGNSYGGAVTILANKIAAGQKVSVGFSVGSQQWDLADCPPNDNTCGSPVQKALLSAAKNAKNPAFFLQAKWDYDTRTTIDLAYAEAYGGSDHTHGQRFMAAIFPYENPCAGRPCTKEDYQDVHTGFFATPRIWGPYVLDFFREYGVK